MVLDTLTLTLLFIFISAFVAVLIRKIKKDKCLKDFRKNTVILENRDGKRIKGKMNVKSTGLEFVYPQTLNDESGFFINTFLLYKTEYSDINLLIRYIDDMNQDERDERNKELKRTFHPLKLRRFLRKVANLLRTVKDSILEIFNLASNHLGKNTAVGMVMASQDKYINKIMSEIFATVDNSFEALLENYIGYRVILELNKGENIIKYKGILKRYTSEFIELIDVDYSDQTNTKDNNRNDERSTAEIKKEEKEKVDMIIPRRYGIVRGLAEEWSHNCL
ncbi:MAG: hypothetical protein ACOCQW_03520 [Halanaerobiaceae bacterium]